VIFNRLGAEQIEGIVRIQLQAVEKKRLQEKKISIDYDPAALELLSKKGYDSGFWGSAS